MLLVGFSSTFFLFQRCNRAKWLSGITPDGSITAELSQTGTLCIFCTPHQRHVLLPAQTQPQFCKGSAEKAAKTILVSWIENKNHKALSYTGHQEAVAWKVWLSPVSANVSSVPWSTAQLWHWGDNQGYTKWIVLTPKLWAWSVGWTHSHYTSECFSAGEMISKCRKRCVWK